MMFPHEGQCQGITDRTGGGGSKHRLAPPGLLSAGPCSPKLLLRDGDFVIDKVAEPASILAPALHLMKLLGQLHDALHAFKEFRGDVIVHLTREF